MADESLDIPFHPYATIFPMVLKDSDEFKELASDIRENGQHEPAILYNGTILDGITRYRIAKEYSLPFNTKNFEGTDEEAFDLVLSLNLHRRHLNEHSRAMSAARAAKRLGKVDNKGEVKTETKDYLHKTFLVSPRTIEYAFKVLNFDDADLIASVDSGKYSVSLACKIIKYPASHRQELIYGEPNAARQKIKILERQERELKFAGKVRSDINKAATNGETKLYGVIYIDPPWPFDTWSIAGKDRSPDQHYKTMTLEEIRALEMPAAEECALFLWTTVAQLDNAIDILQGWGFEYRSSYFWHKLNKGLGYWSRNEIEILLLGIKEQKRGTIPAPTEDVKMPQVIVAKQGEHSSKPETFGSGINRMFPHTPSVEMFARHIANRGKHWTYLGNEIDGSDLRELMHHDESNEKVSAATTNGNGKKRNRKAKNNGAPGATKEETGAEESIGP